MAELHGCVAKGRESAAEHNEPGLDARKEDRRRDNEEEEEEARVEDEEDRETEREAASASWVVGAGVFIVYVLTMHQTVPGGDSGELIVAACTAGVPHPPGYPTYTMLGMVMHAMIPLPSPAWRVNLLSVLVSTGCAVLHFRAIYLWDAQLAQSNKSPPPDPHPDPHPASPTPTLTEPSGTGGGGGEGVGRAGAKYNACSKHNEHNEPGSTDREAGIATDNAPGIATSRVAARAARQERKGSNSRGRDGSVGSNCRGRDARKQRRGNKESLESKERLERWCNASALGAAFGAGSMAVCPLMWQYAIQAEVFALNNFFVAVLLLLTVRYYRRARVRTAYFGSLAIGLGLTNQHTLLFYAAPLAACILHRGRKDLLFKPSRVAVLCAWGLLGLTPYIYLPLAGRRPPLGAWGEVDTAQGFSTHFLRKEYGTFRLYSGEDGSKESEVERVRRAMTLYLRHLAEDGTWVYGACPLVMLGGLLRSLCSSLSRSVFNSSASALLLAYLTYMIGFHLLANLPLDKALYYQVHVRFWMQAHVIAFAWLGLGVSGVLRAVETASWASPRSNGSSLSAPAATDACVRQGRLRIGAACCFLALLLQVGTLWRRLDESHNQYVRQYGLLHLQNLPSNSILIVKGDVITNSIRYLQRCEGLRPDVQHLDQSMMTYKWFVRKQASHFPGIVFPNQVYNPYTDDGYAMETFLDENAQNASRPVYLCGGWYHDEGSAKYGGGIPGYRTWPVGMCDRIRAEGDEPSLEEWVGEMEALKYPFRPPPVDKYVAGTWERVTHDDYWTAQHKLPLALLEAATENNFHVPTLRQAAARFEELVREHPEAPDYAYRNAGITWGRIPSHVSNNSSHCQMVRHFGNFLLMTQDDAHQASTRDVGIMIRNFLAFSQIMAERGSPGADCETAIVSLARRAYRRHRHRLTQTSPSPSK